MVHLMRKYQQTVMLLVTVVVIVSFIWLFNGQQGANRNRAEHAGSVYGRSVSMTQFSREQRKFSVCQELNLEDLWQSLVGDARNEKQAIENYVWNSFVLHHEAAALGVVPSTSEVIDAIQKNAVFQTNATYDSAKYNAFLERLGSRGFTGEQIEELISDDLALAKLKTLIGTSLGTAPAELRNIFERGHQKTEVSVVRLKREDVDKSIQVADEEVKKTYEERKDSLKSEELRKVRFVEFAPDKSEKPVVGKERVTALLQLADRAQNFAVAMAEKDANIEAVAKKFNAVIVETPAFSANQPPAQLSAAQEAVRATFETLTMEAPNSDVILSGGAYYVLQLTSITAPSPLSFEQAKASLTAQIKSERVQETLNLKGAELHTKIQAGLTAGKSFAEAAEAAGAKAETLPAFSMSEPLKSDLPDAYPVMIQSSQMEVGQLSQALPSQTGSVLIHLDKHQPIDEQKFEQERTALSDKVTRGKRNSAVALWIKERRTLAKIGATDS